MASPFKVFRKNQKVWVVGLIMVAMLGFVFLPTILDTMGGRETKNPVAFTSKYGDLTEMELQNLQEYHSRIIGILASLFRPLGADMSKIEEYLKNQLGGSEPEDVIESWLLVQRAKEMGMSVSDQMIKDFLNQFTYNQTDVGVLKNSIKRSRLSDRTFMELMRNELLALTLKNYFRSSTWATTPGQRWDYYCRLRRAAAIEAAPIYVADYIDRVKEEPTDDELKEFFEKHKDKSPVPHSPEPGFKRPQKVELEYFKAELDKFTTPELISEEEVLERYNKDKEKYDLYDKYDKMDRSPVYKTPGEPADDKPAEKQQADIGEEKTTQPEAAPEKEKVPVKEEKEPVEEKQPEATPAETPKDVAEPKSSSAADRSPFKFTAFQQPDDGEKADPKTPEKPAVKPAAEKAEPKKPEKPAVEPAAEKAESAEKKPQETEKTAESKPESPKETDAEKKADQPKSGPSDSVKKIIRNQIANERIGEMFKRLGDQMDSYRDKRNEYEFSSPAQKAASTPPEPLDFDKLAEENGLTAGRTGLADKWEVAKSELRFLSEHAFKAMAKYRPEAMQSGGNFFLFWKTNETPEKDPDFDDPDVRDKVLHAWKMEKARELAQQEAETLAEEARAAKKPLAEVFADRNNMQVIQPLPFTWMTLGYAARPSQQRPIISAVEDVEYAGEDFMKTVFRLEPDGIGTAMNAPENTIYVIRLIDYSPIFNTLWEGYKVTNFSTYASVAQWDQQQMFQDWIEEIKRDADFKWTEEHYEFLERSRAPRDEQQ